LRGSGTAAPSILDVEILRERNLTRKKKGRGKGKKERKEKKKKGRKQLQLLMYIRKIHTKLWQIRQGRRKGA
jgi:hypothetical protein